MLLQYPAVSRLQMLKRSLEQSSLAWQLSVACRRRVSRTGRRTDAAVFFTLYKLPKTVTVTTLLLFGNVTLLCGTFLCIKDPSDRPAPDMRSRLIRSHWFGPDTTSRGVSGPERNFTPRRLWEIHTETEAGNWRAKAAPKSQCEMGLVFQAESVWGGPANWIVSATVRVTVRLRWTFTFLYVAPLRFFRLSFSFMLCVLCLQSG